MEPKLFEGIPLMDWQQFTRATHNLRTSLSDIEGEKIVELNASNQVNVGTPDDRINKVPPGFRQQLEEELAAFETDSFKAMMAKLEDGGERKKLEDDIMRARTYLLAI
ncbi:MAG: hypothetical protein JWP09_835 [Candidatus Taylorbacteria bacterium]|nr:hypothetical protein [Candidatus Taylorbacteria bacterium]